MIDRAPDRYFKVSPPNQQVTNAKEIVARENAEFDQRTIKLRGLRLAKEAAKASRQIKSAAR